MKLNSVLAFLALSVVIVLGGCSHSSYLESSALSEESMDSEEKDQGDASERADPSTEEPEEAETIIVQVAGAVEEPGVYELEAGARLFEAIQKAGGLSKKADDIPLNLAAPISDGEKIYVYRKGEQRASAVSDGQAASVGAPAGFQDAGSIGTETASGDLVNLNTADLAGLMTLSGVGEVKAQAILSYRQSNGGFHAVEELKQVDGIGEATFQKLKDHITI
ncbi:MAG: helix-hairpin-helix domain-containing protein [Lachnospiraceae bacterium]|nr:helix-hairpin-helix domain-containing protein [Lachnospiraceae bacterium]